MELLGIIGDPHLGAGRFRKHNALGMNTYSEILFDAWKEAIDTLLDQGCKHIIIPGDLFHSPNPTVKSMVELNKTLQHMPNDVHLYILGGNHEWSAAAEAGGFHAFNVIPEMENVHLIYHELQCFQLDGCLITFIPYKSLNSKSFSEAHKWNRKAKNEGLKNILVAHGMVDLMNVGENDDYSIPKNVAENYDAVITGHVHVPVVMQAVGITLLTPGSLMPSPQADPSTHVPSVYTMNIENMKTKTIILESSPKVFHCYTDDINRTLTDVIDGNVQSFKHHPSMDPMLKNGKNPFKNSILMITYSGTAKDVDEGIYKKVLEISLHVSLYGNIQTYEFESDAVQLTDFWTFVKDNHPDWYDEFKNITKGA